MLALAFCHCEHSLDDLTKEMWRAAMALSIERSDTPNGRRCAELDTRLAGQVRALLSGLRSRGRVRAELPVEDLGDLVFNALTMLFIEFVRAEQDTMAALRARAAAQIGPLARMMATP